MLLPLLTCLTLVWASVRPSAVTVPQETPASVAQSLFAADSGFAASAASVDIASAFSPMLTDGVIMPGVRGAFAVGKAAVIAAIMAGPDSVTARLTWHPLRVGVSGDGAQGFSFGYMTENRPGTPPVPFKYMAYWVRTGGSWQVAAYKRSRASSPPQNPERLAPALPRVLVAVKRDAAHDRELRLELMQVERSFSDESQVRGLGHAFAMYGSADAVNMGGPAAEFVVSALDIAQHVSGGDMQASPFIWSADTAIVATSGDLGVTIGVIHPKSPPPGADPNAGYPFFTIWRRAAARAPWRFVAE